MPTPLAAFAAACRTSFGRGRPAPARRGRTAGPAQTAAETLEERVVLSATGWFAGIASTSRVVTSGSAVDDAGNQIATGSYNAQGELDLDGTGTAETFTAGEYGGGFVAKYDPAGALLWARQIAARTVTFEGGMSYGAVYGQSLGGDVATDARGNVYFAATFGGQIEFLGRDADGNTRVDATLTPRAPGFDVVVAKYAPDGTLLWAKSIGGLSGSDYAHGIAVDDRDANEANWSFYLAGRTGAGADFDPGAGEAVRQYSGGYLAKYSAADAGLRWVRQVTAASGVDHYFAPYQGVAVDANGVYVGGFFGGYAYVEGGAAATATIFSNGNTSGMDGLLASYTHDGNLRWTQRIGGAGDQLVYGVDVSGGAVYATGRFLGTADFEMTHEDRKVNDDLASAGGFDGFVAKYTAAAGRRTWAKRFGGAGDDAGLSVAADAVGSKVAVGGFFQKTANFSGDVPALSTPDPTTAYPDALAALLSDAGTSARFANVWRMGGAGSGATGAAAAEEVTDVAFDPRGTGALYVAGNFSSPTAAFPNGQTLLRQNEKTDVFIGRFVPSASPAVTGVAAAPTASPLRTTSSTSGATLLADEPTATTLTAASTAKKKQAAPAVTDGDSADALFAPQGGLLDVLLAG